VVEVNISLLRRFRGFSLTGGGVLSRGCCAGVVGCGFSRPAGFLRVVRFIVVEEVLLMLRLLGMDKL